jgi:hypothetical protein
MDDQVSNLRHIAATDATNLRRVLDAALELARVLPSPGPWEAGARQVLEVLLLDTIGADALVKLADEWLFPKSGKGRRTSPKVRDFQSLVSDIDRILKDPERPRAAWQFGTIAEVMSAHFPATVDAGRTHLRVQAAALASMRQPAKRRIEKELAITAADVKRKLPRMRSKRIRQLCVDLDSLLRREASSIPAHDGKWLALLLRPGSNRLDAAARMRAYRSRERKSNK